VFPSSRITNVTYYGEAGPGPAGTVLTVDFVLDGQEYTAINGGPEFRFTEAISLLINCADQDEVDYYWAKLTDGGEEVQCGWLRDRYGLSWQVCPVGMGELLNDPDQGRSQRAMRAMLGMKKIDWPPSTPPSTRPSRTRLTPSNRRRGELQVDQSRRLDWRA
jgi:predicted 3-demethylubiquinone-9 3-methyltransferase (glyoxalase superfamily)